MTGTGLGTGLPGTGLPAMAQDAGYAGAPKG